PQRPQRRPGWALANSPDSGAQKREATRARDLAIGLKHWLRRYRGVSTRWLRGYLALFAELYEGGWATATQQFRQHRPGMQWSRWQRFREQRWAALTWRLVDISVRALEGPAARDRRCWVR
ncbi:MAG: hypothetical protein EA422_00035, partial [Gemmatimonadales bacterium]